MTERITDEDIQFLEHQVTLQNNIHYLHLARMDLKIAKAVKKIEEILEAK